MALLLMHDIGFTPIRDGGAARQAKAVLKGAIQYGFANRPVRWVMIASAFTDGVAIYGFYAMQPYLLDLYGDPKAYGVAGLSAAIVGGAQIAGGLLVSRLSRVVPRRMTPLLAAVVASGLTLVPIGLVPRFPVAVGLLVVWDSICHRHAGPQAYPQRADSIRAASHRPVVRFVDGVCGWSGCAAIARQGRGRVGLSDVLPVRCHDPTVGLAVHLAGPTRAARSLTRSAGLDHREHFSLPLSIRDTSSAGYSRNHQYSPGRKSAPTEWTADPQPVCSRERSTQRCRDTSPRR
jgi:hypothetical protein